MTPFAALPSSHQAGQRGIVLPVVLVMLLLMTITVLFLMRRGTVDELLASNVRQITTLETATQFALRSCERWLGASTPGFAPRPGDPDPPPVVIAPVATDPPAWRVADNWNNSSVDLPVAEFGTGITRVRCLIEDATAELELNRNTDQSAQIFMDNKTPPNWRKFRVTAEVQGNGNTFSRAQAESRMRVPAL